MQVPKEKEYNIGNTTFGASPSGGVKWCIDHLQGFIYNKVIDPHGAMYYECVRSSIDPRVESACSGAM